MSESAYIYETMCGLINPKRIKVSLGLLKKLYFTLYFSEKLIINKKSFNSFTMKTTNPI